jgi:hypothetical protein
MLVVLVGAVLLAATFAFPIYTINLSGTGSNDVAVSEVLSINAMNICVSATGTAPQGSGYASVTGCETYFQAGGGGGMIIATVLVVLSILLGLLGVLFGYRQSTASGEVSKKPVKRPYTYSRNAAIIGVIGVLIFFGISYANVGQMASVICTSGGSGVTGSCPVNSQEIALTGGTMSWSPSWFFLILGFVGFALMLVGAIMFRGYYKSMAKWIPGEVLTAPPQPSPFASQAAAYYPQDYPQQPYPEQMAPQPYPQQYPQQYSQPSPPPAGAAGPASMAGQATGGQGQGPWCPTCGGATTYVANAKSWYCTNCSMMVR